MTQHHSDRPDIVGDVDTHKELHMAPVVDTNDRVLGTASIPTTRHDYKTMLAWMRSFGELSRVGLECTGTYDVMPPWLAALLAAQRDHCSGGHHPRQDCPPKAWQGRYY